MTGISTFFRVISLVPTNHTITPVPVKELGKVTCTKLQQNTTKRGGVTHIRVSTLTIMGSDNGLSPGCHQAIIWTKCRNIVNWILRNKLQWNVYRNLYICVQENAFEIVVMKLTAILSRPQCVNTHNSWDVPCHLVPFPSLSRIDIRVGISNYIAIRDVIKSGV